jgi:hypothetical protein
MLRKSTDIEKDICRITDLVLGPEEGWKIECQIDGTMSGVPAAFMDAIEREDPSGDSAERFHELLVEYANVVAVEKGIEVPRLVIVEFLAGCLNLSTK